MSPAKKWSTMSPQELLDEAQARLMEYEKNPRKDDRTMYRGYAIDRDVAMALIAAAQVQAIENRVVAAMGTKP